ncbi:MAG: hypothetical protein FWB84_08265 [Candidatus Bathyarchaeota archaeon]|uniref:hypothetical protein n=1 Tax=Candidatus Bathycorpusculum sp. TaxID=2994959 RepID=UPI002820A042|nr:hypothetical protein [Candidatus Termiticorpusculum sp.]MCL2256808.1 hypothetical protein [Candidatus Termiticorpusculum sp.]MCL2293086.1 hypothetical protein [Candidatus Termiticorpusculum sp.]
MSEFEKERQKGKQLTKELALADISEWITKLPRGRANEPAIVVGSKTFTPEELKKEIENDTEYGQEYSQMLAKSRIELTRRNIQ